MRLSKSLEPESYAVAWTLVALEAESADARRDAVIRLSDSRHLDRDQVIEALCLIARTDRSPMVRCTAIHALAKSNRIEPSVTLAEIIDAEPGNANVRPAEQEVLTDALTSASTLASRGLVHNRAEDQICHQAAIDVERNRDRNVRIAAARLLGYCSTPASLEVLINVLGQSDFGVVYEASKALEQRTGESFGIRKSEWEAWRSQEQMAP